MPCLTLILSVKVNSRVILTLRRDETNMNSSDSLRHRVYQLTCRETNEQSAIRVKEKKIDIQ
jgi:hypothetical protein